MLKLSSIRMAYGAIEAVKGVDLEVRAGEEVLAREVRRPDRHDGHHREHHGRPPQEVAVTPEEDVREGCQRRQRREHHRGVHDKGVQR